MGAFDISVGSFNTSCLKKISMTNEEELYNSELAEAYSVVE
jgi:hypothetical protein